HSAFQNLILNVPKILSGKFSFVGPKEGNVSDLYLGKKGLTGLWYIDESQGNSEKLDIFYAKNQNVWLDLEILGKTLNKMWNSKK
ncbi:MAG: glycosyl transferase, partial [Ignavibacteria bacterium CG_4_9_14_3_um_filter_36_18]